MNPFDIFQVLDVMKHAIREPENIANAIEKELFGGISKFDVIEKDTEYIVYVDLPGVAKSDIKIEYDNSYLTIKSNRQFDYVEAIVSERTQGEFCRKLPFKNIKKITSKLDNGVLTVMLQKKDEEKFCVEIE